MHCAHSVGKAVGGRAYAQCSMSAALVSLPQKPPLPRHSTLRLQLSRAGVPAIELCVLLEGLRAAWCRSQTMYQPQSRGWWGAPLMLVVQQWQLRVQGQQLRTPMRLTQWQR